MKINKKKPTKSKSLIIITIVTAVAIVLGVGVFVLVRQPQEREAERGGQATTEQTKESVEEAPVSDVQENSTEKTENVYSKKIDVVPIIASYGLKDGQLDISGMVTGVVDAGGTCTITISWGSQTRSASSEATTGPSSTVCASVRISVEDITDTEPILVKLSYSSNRYTGESSNNPIFTLKDLH